GQRLRSPAREVGAAAHGVLELRAVRLDPKADPARCATRRPEQNMIREHEVGGSKLTQRRGIRLDVRLPLLPGEVAEEPRLEPLVAVEHEDGEQPPGQLRYDDPRTAEV